MATPYFFAVKSIGLSTCGGRKPCTLLSALRHNRRIIQTELGARLHIDPSRSHLNEALAGAPTPEAVAMLAITAMAWAGVPVETLRRDHTQAIELLFSLPVGALADDRAYFKTCTAWATRQFGADNILSSDIHRDESAPHCHVLVLPLVGGRMAGSTLIARDKTARLIESFWREVAQPAGLNRPPKRVTGAAKGLMATRVIETLQGRADPATQSPAWQAIRKAIEFDPQGFAVVLGLEAAMPTSKKQKTMAQIFTSKGKGANVERKPIGFDALTSKPIGIAEQPQNHQSLSCVGFTIPKRTRQPQEAYQPGAMGDYERVPDPDFDPAIWADSLTTSETA